jgi:hypothetical protein
MQEEFVRLSLRKGTHPEQPWESQQELGMATRTFRKRQGSSVS